MPPKSLFGNRGTLSRFELTRANREHLKNDLDPYVCLFESCEAAGELYSHSEPWLKHMRQHAVRWHCMAKSHGPLRFEKREDYEDHMRQDHAGKFTDLQLSTLADRNARMTGPLFSACPLCGATESDEKVGGRLEHHIVGHLRCLALKSLPRIDEEEQNSRSSHSTSSDNSAKPADRSTLRDLAGDGDGNSEIVDDDRDRTAMALDDGRDEDPYARWGGIRYYVEELSSLGTDDGQAIVKWRRSVYSLDALEAASTSEFAAAQADLSTNLSTDSIIFDPFTPVDKPHDIRQKQWGWILDSLPQYDGPENDAILRSFHDAQNPPASSIQTLQEGLRNSTVYGGAGPDSFVPMNAIFDLCTQANLETILPLHQNLPIDFITDKAPRCFAILVAIGLPYYLTLFSLFGFSDDQLPIDLDVEEISELGRPNQASRALDSAAEKTLPGGRPVSLAFEGWTERHIAWFCAYQWLFLAPVFTDDEFEHVLEPAVPLPFLEDASHVRRPDWAKHGPLHTYTARIHSAHLQLNTRVSDPPYRLPVCQN